MNLSKTECPLETIEQQRVVSWADHRRIGHFVIGSYLFAIPNGGSRRKTEGRFSHEAARMKREGVRSGVPDLMLAIPSGTKAGLFIEMKRRSKNLSSVSPAQKEWHERLADAGYEVVVAYGADEAIEYIKKYLELKE